MLGNNATKHIAEAMKTSFEEGNIGESMDIGTKLMIEDLINNVKQVINSTGGNITYREKISY